MRAIVVRGDVSHNSVASLRANVASRACPARSYSMDLGQVRAAFESVPWVRQAMVRREFPPAVVQLQEHRPRHIGGTEGELRLINATFGEVFEANVGEVEQDNLPRLNGPEGRGRSAGHAACWCPCLTKWNCPSKAGAQRWRQLARACRYRCRHRRSAAAARLRLARVERFLKTLTQVTCALRSARSSIGVGDLRHDNGYALPRRRWVLAPRH